MTNPNVEKNFRGYTGTMVDEPPESLWRVTEDDGFEDHVLTVSGRMFDHYFDIAVGHAVDLVYRLVAQRQSGTTDMSDLGAVVARVTPAESPGQQAYAEGFCSSLADSAQQLRGLVELLEKGFGQADRDAIGEFFERVVGVSQPVFEALVDELPGVVDGDSIDELFRRAGGLSKVDVLELADQFEYLTRSVSRRAQIPLPLALQPAGQGYVEPPWEQDVAARELAVLVDQYSAVRAVPHLAGPTASGRADFRERLAARIAVASSRNPGLLGQLSPDRVEVVRFLVPAVDIPQSPRTPSRESLSEAAAELYETTTALIRSMDAPAGGMSSRGQLLRQVAALHERDPAIAGQLPSTHAGVAREIAARFGRNSATGPAATVQTTGMVAGKATALDTSSQQLRDLPGTAGSRHASVTQPPGSVRGR